MQTRPGNDIHQEKYDLPKMEVFKTDTVCSPIEKGAAVQNIQAWD